MGVGGTRHAGGRLWSGLTLASLVADGCQALVRTRPQGERPSTSRGEALGAVAFAEPHAPSTGPAPLLGRRPCSPDSCDDLGGGGATGGRPVAQARGRPCGRVLVGLGPVGGHRTMAAFVGRARVTGDAFPRGDACHHGGTQADVQRLAHQRVGHGGVVAVHLPMVIDIATGALPLSLLIGRRWPRPERRAVAGLNQCWAGARPVLQGAGIEGRQEGSAGRIDLGQREEGVMPQAGQHPACHDWPAHCDFGLLPGRGRPCREHGQALGLRQGRRGPLERGVSAVGPGDGRFEVSRDDALGDPAERRQGPHV
jgi:hypothetical protein